MAETTTRGRHYRVPSARRRRELASTDGSNRSPIRSCNCPPGPIIFIDEKQQSSIIYGRSGDMGIMHEVVNGDALASDRAGPEVVRPSNPRNQEDLLADPPVDSNVGWGKTTE